METLHENPLKSLHPQDDGRARYEILRVVNRGGMGEIALGRVKGTKGFEKLVVLKRLRADAERDDHLAMFDVEQELMSRIEHPNIVKVFDQPIIEDTPYLAMEYVRGRNLDQVIRQSKDLNDKLSVQFCLTVTSEVLRGLSFVHRLKDSEGNALGVVHQDITPSNIMVSFFGEVKITDFGISYVTSRDGGLRRGVLKGKPRYVAPEVLAGKRVNNRADLYGVGVVLYELLTQQALFARPSVKETLAAVARGEIPDMATLLPNMSEGLAQLLVRSLAKDPADRYRTAEEMGADVVAELAKQGGPLSPGRLGYVVRQYFRDDPDVPEVEASFEAALSAEAQPVLPASFRPPDLIQTLSELDRLLPRGSTDVFTLPPELQNELANIADMDPFRALTPLPDFVWDASSEAEILRRAGQEFGPPGGSLREPPPLGIPDEASGAPPGLSEKKATPPAPFSAQKIPDDAPLAVPSASRSQSRPASVTTESSPPPLGYNDRPMLKRAGNGARPGEEAALPPKDATPRAEEARADEPRRRDGAALPSPTFDPVMPAPAGAPSAPAQAPQEVRVARPRASSSARTELVPASENAVETGDTRSKNTQFWLGLAVGLGLGLMTGAALVALLLR